MRRRQPHAAWHSRAQKHTVLPVHEPLLPETLSRGHVAGGKNSQAARRPAKAADQQRRQPMDGISVSCVHAPSLFLPRRVALSLYLLLITAGVPFY